MMRMIAVGRVSWKLQAKLQAGWAGFDGRQGAAAPGQPPTQQRAALLESVLTEVSRYSIGRAPDLRLAT